MIPSSTLAMLRSWVTVIAMAEEPSLQPVELTSFVLWLVGCFFFCRKARKFELHLSISTQQISHSVEFAFASDLV